MKKQLKGKTQEGVKNCSTRNRLQWKWDVEECRGEEIGTGWPSLEGCLKSAEEMMTKDEGLFKEKEKETDRYGVYIQDVK